MWRTDFRQTSNQVQKLDPELARGCTDVSWDEVRSKLVEASQKIQVKVINGAAKDALDYQDHPGGLSAIAIGGDKLSRGLTLEGLSVSYYLRASRMYDTLLQMGRWFGYRPGFVDICRLYTTVELRECYSHIAMATEELREEFDRMAGLGMTPNQFGLRVRIHPAGLSVTSASKMRDGTRMTVSYSAAYAETLSFDRNSDVILKKPSAVQPIHSVSRCTTTDNKLRESYMERCSRSGSCGSAKRRQCASSIVESPWRPPREVHTVSDRGRGACELDSRSILQSARFGASGHWRA